MTFLCYNHNDMKYIKAKFTNLILIILSVLLVFYGCGEETFDESSESSANSFSFESQEESKDPQLSVEDAKTLLERDRKITEMFVCNSLVNYEPSANTLTRPLDEGSEFHLFETVEALLDSTYVQEGGNKDYFLKYPSYGAPSVYNVDGITNVFNHPGSIYSDFADLSTLSVSDTEDVSRKTLKVTTVSGKEVSLSAVLHEDKWLLEKGIFLSNPLDSSPLTGGFASSGLGSFSSLTGKLLVIELYVHDDGSEFTEEKKIAFHSKVVSAFSKIESEAKKYSSDVTFEYKEAHFEHDGVVGTRDYDFDVVFAETGFGNKTDYPATLRAFAEETCGVSEYDGYFFVVCLDKNMKSYYNYYLDTSETELYYGERIVVGNNVSSQEIAYAAVRSLGGQSYGGYLGSLYKAYFPKDIIVYDDFENCEISEFTAYACGIIKELSPFFRVFRVETE